MKGKHRLLTAKIDCTKSSIQMEKKHNLMVRTATGLLFVVVVVGGIMLSPLSFVCIFSLITALTVREYCQLINNRPDSKVHVPTTLLIASSVYLFLAQALYLTLGTPVVFAPCFLFFIAQLVRELYLKRPSPIGNWAYGFFGQVYIALPFSLLVWLYAFFSQPDLSSNSYLLPDFLSNSRVFEASFILPLSVFALLWANDTGAYCLGSLFGRHHLFPRISPGKTWEGFVGGVLVAALISLIMWRVDAHHLAAYSAIEWVGLALVVSGFGTWGDLVESLFKRQLGLKDSGHILPGHGGMLDRFDSSLMAIPAALCYIFFIEML